ncbi:hypothetical protein [Hymenobacter latericus]|uniref:hypothetical protein n=1 Tax=Hymenobacter sp. YIM 151858-1 TaxID=2987688 RepID=UPI002227C326|nr:hypothetical protein [Hymenobacter sp. YIM 151858-1]UYZ60209.1 hypothetical protein OIS50_05265 [Hymenobacter sp. YIM 151858-1]
MNYIHHTRTAHRLLTCHPHAKPQHVSLYWALFFAWNAERFPEAFDLDHAAAMQAARIGNKRTYTDTLYDLVAWGLLTYQPSKSKYQPSRCRMTVLPVAEVPPVEAGTSGTSATSEPAPSGAEVPPVNTPTRGTSATGEPVSPVADVPQHSLLDKTGDVLNTTTSNGGSGLKKRRNQVFAGEGQSAAEVFEDDLSTIGAAEAPKKKVAPKKKGVQQATIRQAAARAATTARTEKARPQRPEVPFAESGLARYEDFAAAFASTDYELADLRFYHAQVANWRKDGEPPRRRDWKATATKFMLNDAHDNRLKLAPNVQRSPDGSLHQQPAGSGPAGTGYVSKWDR